ncbi:hypothetical protein EV368DRAFT_69277 [Lentinula lateritia]|nr:hypothetical protein EV368DRAFT_69277 [Lentinula lateritia]
MSSCYPSVSIDSDFIGQGKLWKGWLHSIFEVHCDFVGGALLWLKEAKNKHYEDIDFECIHCLPLNGVPEEILEVVRHSINIRLVDKEQDGCVPGSEDINEVNEAQKQDNGQEGKGEVIPLQVSGAINTNL